MHLLRLRTQFSAVVLTALFSSILSCGAATDDSKQAISGVKTGPEGDDDADDQPADAGEGSASDDTDPGPDVPDDTDDRDGGVVPPTPPGPPGPNPPDPDPTPGADKPGLLETLVPFQVWPDLDPAVSAIGLLFTGELADGVYAFDHGRAAGPSDQSSTYRFTADGSSPYVLYFESTGAGFNYLDNWKVPVTDGSGEAQFDAAQFGPDDLARFGVSKPVHLVKLQVNAGRGGSGLHFVATDGEVLDGTQAYPFDPTALLVDAAAQAAKVFGTSDFSTLLEQARQDALADLSEPAPMAPAMDLAPPAPERLIAPPPQVPVPSPNGSAFEEPLVSVNGFWPDWNNKTSTLRVVFVLREAAQWVELGEESANNPNCPPGAPCLPPRPTRAAKLSLYGMETAVVYEFDPQGALKATEVFAPRAVPFAGRVDTHRDGF
ncbi:MAG: hypothetical protein RJA70_1163 [Pseudomonadota bacterium]|jgi:hypothetical protein